jgi:hypothetical protein
VLKVEMGVGIGPQHIAVNRPGLAAWWVHASQQVRILAQPLSSFPNATRNGTIMEYIFYTVYAIFFACWIYIIIWFIVNRLEPSINEYLQLRKEAAKQKRIKAWINGQICFLIENKYRQEIPVDISDEEYQCIHNIANILDSNSFFDE